KACDSLISFAAIRAVWARSAVEWLVAGDVRSSDCQCLWTRERVDPMRLARSMLRPAVPSRHSPLTLLRMLCDPAMCQMVGTVAGPRQPPNRPSTGGEGHAPRVLRASAAGPYHSRLLIEPEGRLG